MGEHTESAGRGNGHLVVYLAWPLLAGMGLAVVLALCVGGGAALLGKSLGEAARTMGWAFIVTWGLATVGVFLYAMFGWAGPLRIERMRQEVITEEIILPPEEPDASAWPVYRGLARREMLPSGMDLQTMSIEPPVDPQVKELYDFISCVLPTGNVARSHCDALGFGRACWERMVGGQRGKEGQESGRGILDRTGVVYRDAGGHWQIAPGVNLEMAYGINDELRTYAGEKARLVRYSRDGADGTGRDSDGRV